MNINQECLSISLNKTNNVGLYNNTYIYNFKQGNYDIQEDDTLHINSINLPNSVANVSSQYNNNQFAYMMSGLAFNGGTDGVIAFTVDATITNLNVVNITTTSGYLYIGYVVTFSGLTTTNPIYVTDITYNTSNSITLTLNQSISVSASTAGSGFIVGNKVVINVNIVTNGVMGIPRVNMYIPSSSIISNNGYDLFTYITNVSQYPSIYYTLSYYLLTLNTSIPYSSRVTNITTTNYNLYINWVNLSTGYYDIPSINKALQKTMYDNGHYYFRNSAGSNNATIIYPQSIVYSNTNYGIYKTNSERQPVLPTDLSFTYGTNVSYNNIIIQNGNFNFSSSGANKVSIDNPARTAFPYWTLNGNETNNIFWALGNGNTNYITYHTPPSPSKNWIGVVLNAIISPITATPSFSQKFYALAGTYSYGFYGYKTTVNGTSNLITVTITGPLLYSNTNTYTFASNRTWTYFTYTPTAFTQDGNYTITFTYQTPAGSTAQDYAIAGITISQTNTSLTPIGTYWVNGFENNTNDKVEIYLNLNQNTSTYNATPDKYSLGYMTLGVTDLYTTKVPNTPLYVMPYGKSMNFINGVIIKCNLVSNKLYYPTDILDAFSFIYPFGSNNIYSGDDKNLINLIKGKYNNITFQICDQNGNPLILLDNNIFMSLILRKKTKRII